MVDVMEDELRTLLSFSRQMVARWRTGYKWRGHTRGRRRGEAAVSCVRVPPRTRASVSSMRSWSLFGVLRAAPPARFHSQTAPSRPVTAAAPDDRGCAPCHFLWCVDAGRMACKVCGCISSPATGTGGQSCCRGTQSSSGYGGTTVLDA